MTLLSICTAACNIVPVTPPATIVGNSNQTARMLLALADLAGQEVARRPEGGWVSMIKQYEFALVALTQQEGSIDNSGPGGNGLIQGLSSTAGIAANSWIASGPGVMNQSIVTAVTDTTVTINQPATAASSGNFQFAQSDYVLPSDFQRAVDDTFWDRTNYWKMRGPLSPQQWQWYKSSNLGYATIYRRYRFRRISGATRLSIDPTPFIGAGTADDDGFAIGESDIGGPDGIGDSVGGVLTTGARLVFEYVSNAYCESAAGVAQTSWTADTDIGVVDEYLVQLGIQWRLLNRLGLSYSAEMAEYERQLDKAVATDGAAAILPLVPMTAGYLLGPQNVQDGFFPGPGGGAI